MPITKTGHIQETSGVAIKHIWTGSGIGSAPSATNMRDGTVGADSAGASTGIVYHVVDGVWTSTTATVANMFGG